MVPKLVGNDTSHALLANLVHAISLFLVSNMALGGHFEKGAVEILSSHFLEVHSGLLFLVYFVKSIKKLRFIKNGHGS